MPVSPNRRPEATPPMLRNDLIVLMSAYDNDTVVADVNGILIDVESVDSDRESIVLVLNQDDLRSVTQWDAPVADQHRPGEKKPPRP